jgi:hypothetical protein
MKIVTEFLREKGSIFSDFRAIKKELLATKKQLEIYSGCDTNRHFISVFIVRQKNRFILKDANLLDELKGRLIALEEHNFKQNILLITGDICSKSAKFLKENNWKIYNDFV